MMTDPQEKNGGNDPHSLRVVYHNNGGLPDNKTYTAALLTSLTNHIQALTDPRYARSTGNGFSMTVVCHAAGVDLFGIAQTDEQLKARLDTLRQQDVRFLVCANTLRARNIDWRSLYGVEESDLVPSGVAELAWLQMQGFAYIHL